jgi:3-keto-5-aminohexanoate cleavage enzyme
MIGTKVLLRVRMGGGGSGRVGAPASGSRILALFGDLAAELLVRLDGDEGLFHTYESVEFLASVFPGDWVEAVAEIVDIGATARRIRFEATKVIAQARRAGLPPSAAEVLREPVVVCRAVGTCVTPAELQRRPRELYVPQLPPGEPPTPEAVVTPPGEDEGTALGRTHADVVLMANVSAATVRDVVDDAIRAREAGASVIYLAEPPRAGLDALAARIHESTDCIVRAPGYEAELAVLDCREVGQVEEALVLEREWDKEGAAKRRALTAERATGGDQERTFELVLGAPHTMRATEPNLRYLVGLLPPTALWTLASVAESPQPLLETALRLGGHARAGSELVGRLAAYARAIGRLPADPARARALFGLAKPNEKGAR